MSSKSNNLQYFFFLTVVQIKTAIFLINKYLAELNIFKVFYRGIQIQIDLTSGAFKYDVRFLGESDFTKYVSN